MNTFTSSALTSLRLVIGTTASNAEYVIETSGYLLGGSVTPHYPDVVDIPSDILASSSTQRNKGIHVYTRNGEQIYVLGESTVYPTNHGVFLAYPCLSLESNDVYEYYIVSTAASIEFQSQVFIDCWM